MRLITNVPGMMRYFKITIFVITLNQKRNDTIQAVDVNGKGT